MSGSELTWTGERVGAMLTDPGLPDALDRLGFRPDDRDDAVTEFADLDPEQYAEVAAMAGRLVANLGVIPGSDAADRAVFPFDPAPHGPQLDGRPLGLLALAALVVTADDVRGWHRAHGVGVEDSDRALTDLGQQVWVHRQTYGAFGIHTQGWLAFAGWTGLLFWLGRLQFNLQRRGDDAEGSWVLSTHIPQSGPMTPAAVDDAFVSARAFFAEHFPEQPAVAFFCHSWLLDPQLVDALAPDTNIVAFQRRWHDVEAEGDGNGDALFFVFRRRVETGDGPPQIDLDTLPRSTSLERAMIDKIRAGGHWQVCSGTIPFEEIR